jgi:Na+:H+ antiporter, NhaC family
MSQSRTPSLLQSFLPIIFLIGMLGMNVWFFGEDSSYGYNQMALLFAATMAGIIGMVNGFSWKDLLDGITHSIQSALPAILILLFIGALAGTWLVSGIVPTMIYYGLKILNPTIFLFAACVISAIVSVATGSSWSTVATVGLALLGIGTALGIGEGWIAGAIISGAYFGDKMSPLSDTTNLAPAVAGGELFSHIRHMIWTTGPSITVALIVFLVAGFTVSGEASRDTIEAMLSGLESTFNISAALLVVPLVVIGMIVKKVPALPALMFGSVLGGLVAIVAQPDVVTIISGETENYAKAAYIAFFQSLALETSVPAELEALEKLLSAGGMFGMMNTIWLIVCAMTFGGVMFATGMLQRITSEILRFVTNTASLVGSTVLTCLFFNVTAADQYLAILVPGKMFQKAYADRGLRPENLSRTLEDAGTVTSVLIPWNTCGVAQAGVLGVATGTYAPYAVFNWLSPLMTYMFALWGWKITYFEKEETEA